MVELAVIFGVMYMVASMWVLASIDISLKEIIRKLNGKAQ